MPRVCRPGGHDFIGAWPRGPVNVLSARPVGVAALSRAEGQHRHDDNRYHRMPTPTRRGRGRYSFLDPSPRGAGRCHGHGAGVAPARDAEGHDAVLKVGWTHTEARDEAVALELFDGAGAVRLLRHEQRGTTTALLLERCRPGDELRRRPEHEQHGVVTGILREVWDTQVPPSSPLRPLAEMCDEWVAEAIERDATHPLPLDPGLVGAGRALFVELPRSAPVEVLLCTDLHAGNVLSGERQPWLLIDPKPYVGDPHYDLLQHMLNCSELLLRPRELVAALAAATDLDVVRLRHWLFARCVVEGALAPDLLPVARALAP